MSRHDPAINEREVFSLCKAELRLYEPRRKRYEWLLRHMKERDRPSDYVPDGPGLDPRSRKATGTVSRPTEVAVILHLDEEELAALQAYMDMMDAFFAVLTSEEATLVRLTFFEGKPRDVVMSALHITDVKTYYGLMDRALLRYAIISGLGHAYHQEKMR